MAKGTDDEDVLRRKWTLHPARIYGGSRGAYLREVRAYAKYPGLRVVRVSVDWTDQRVTVGLVAPLDLPLTIPGSPDSTKVGAVGSAVVTVD